jgi:small GTP-binding protein
MDLEHSSAFDDRRSQIVTPMARKLSIVGAAGVGKSSLATRFLSNTFSDRYLSTVGVKVGTRLLNLDNAIDLRLVIWDIAGTNILDMTSANYVKGSSGFMVVADGLRRDTLAVALNLHTELSRTLGSVPSVLLVNKVDLEAQWEFSSRDWRAIESTKLRYVKTSAKEGTCVESAFAELAHELVRV